MAGSTNYGDSESDSQEKSVDEFSKGEELDGKLAHSETLDKLMRSVLESQEQLIDEGMVLSEGLNQGLQAFTPDLLFEQLVNNYKNAKQLFGERFIRELTGYDPSYVERNSRIPEFQRELKEKIQQTVESLQDEGLLDKHGHISDEGLKVATLVMVAEELERMNQKGVLGERVSKLRSDYGEKSDYRKYKKGDRYRDIAFKQTIKRALRRGHDLVKKDDLSVFEKESKERATIIYAIDASGSMRGEKLSAAKRAGIALAYKATKKKDMVGCVVFGKEVEAQQTPTNDFLRIVKLIAKAQASKETDIAATIKHAITLFTGKGKKHLILLTDGLQTIGKDPTEHVLNAVGEAVKHNISISIVGLRLDEKGEELSKKIVTLGKGTLHLVKNYDDLDVVLIEEYYNAKR